MGKKIFNAIKRIGNGLFSVMLISALSLGGVFVYKMLTSTSGWMLVGFILLFGLAFVFGALRDE